MPKEISQNSLSISSTDSSKSRRSDVLSAIGVKSYGTITFRRNHSNRANFIRISTDACPYQVKSLFFQNNQNKQKRPRLIISMSGSAKEFNIKSKLFRMLRQGFLKIAKTTDLSILSCGLNTSVTKLIGEIVRTNPDPSRSIHLIGITSWGCISGVEQLNVRGKNVNYEKVKSNEQDETPLEPNHTHFIFIDDGTKHEFNAQNEYRLKFEQAISGGSISLQTDCRVQSPQIPVVLIIIEGRLDEIKTIYESVTKNNIPVVLLEGTGGCCDLFAKCSHLYNEYHSNQSELIEHEEQIKSKIREKLQIIESQITTNDYFELMYECIDKRSLFLNFIDIKLHTNVDADIDLVILEALLNVTSKTNDIRQKLEQIHFAFDWKRIDIIKNFIMKTDQDWKTIELNDLFIKALLQNQPVFIQLFLDHDFSLDELFQNHQQILNLYEAENIVNHSLESIYTNILRPLIGEFFQVDAFFNSDEIDIEKELFIWAILTRKQELALLFWSRGRNKVCAALIATLLYKSKSRKEKDSSYIGYADEFENLAVEILKKFYVNNPFECTQAIIREIPQFGNVTWLHLAVIAEAKLFIAERGVQDVLSDIWYGYIDHRVGNRTIVLASFMIWYSGFLPYHEDLVEGHEMSVDFQDGSDGFFKQNSMLWKSHRDETTKLMNEIINEEENSIVVIETNPWEKIKSSVYRYLNNVSKFVQAPCVNYLYNLYAHVIFLLLFSYVVLCDFFPLYEFVCIPGLGEPTESNTPLKDMVEQVSMNLNKTEDAVIRYYGSQKHDQPTASEILLDVWIFTLICEEIRQIAAMEVQLFFGKISSYFAIFWNKLDALALLLFLASFVLRWLPFSYCFCAARVCLAIDLSIWYIRTLDIFSAIKRLGPKLVMIGEMVHDMKFYMIMLTVFILAYGVPAYSLLYGVQKFSWHIPRTILNLAYWQMFGELEVLSDIEKNYQVTGYVVFFLLIAYMTVASVLLINLLIAMFSNTFDRLQSDTDCIWKFQHYSLVCYHLTRPVFPPPLVIVSHVYRVTIYILSHVVKIKWFCENYTKHENRSKFKIIADEMLTKKIEAIEDALGNDVYFSLLKTDRQNDLNEDRIHSPQIVILNKIKFLENQIQTIQNQQGNMFEYMKYLMNGIKKIGGDDIDMPQKSRQETDLI